MEWMIAGIVVGVLLLAWFLSFGVQTHIDSNMTPGWSRKKKASLPEYVSVYNGRMMDVADVETMLMDRPGFRASVDMGSGRRSPMNFVAVPEKPYGGRLQITPEGVKLAVERFFGREDLAIGQRDFDERFAVRGEPLSFLVEALTEDVRHLVLNLGKRGVIEFTVNPRRLHIRYKAAHHQVGNLIFIGLQIAEALAATSPKEVVVEVHEANPGQHTECQVCGTELAGKVVECTKCATLHHEDCWIFNGRCSTFACGSIGSKPAEFRSNPG